MYTGGKRKDAVKAEATSASQPKAGRGKKTEIEHDATDEKPSKRPRKKAGRTLAKLYSHVIEVFNSVMHSFVFY